MLKTLKTMEPNSTPPLPNSNNPASGSSDPGKQTNNPSPQVFSHVKVIAPLNSDIKPENPTILAQVAPIVNNQPSIAQTPAPPVYPTVTQLAPINTTQPSPARTGVETTEQYTKKYHLSILHFWYCCRSWCTVSSLVQISRKGSAQFSIRLKRSSHYQKLGNGTPGRTRTYDLDVRTVLL